MNCKKKAEMLDKIARSIREDDVNPALKSHTKNFVAHRDQILSRKNMDDFFLLPIGIDYADNVSVYVFNNKLLVEAVCGKNCDTTKNNLDDEKLEDTFRPLLEKIKSEIEYIYIPKEIDPESFTKLETNEIQILMGERLTDILKKNSTRK